MSSSATTISSLVSRTIHLLPRTTCNAQGDCADLPVSNWQKTGIPVIISVILFAIVLTVLFIIVRKRRIQNKAKETAHMDKIDLDDVEDRAAFQAVYGGRKGPKDGVKRVEG